VSDPRVLSLLAHAHYQNEATAKAQTIILLVFLAWWIPASITGWLVYWGQPLVWLGLLGALYSLDSDSRATVKQAEALRTGSTVNGTLKQAAPHQVN